MTKFRIVEVTVLPEEGQVPDLPGPSFSMEWLEAAGQVISKYWLEMSGGREAVQWFVHPPLQLPMRQAAKDKLTQPRLIQAVKDAAEAAGLPFAADENVVVMMNDKSSTDGTTPATEPIVAAKSLDPALLMHELGHAFQHQAGHPGGHASSPTPFSNIEYNDPTCVMGYEPGPGGSGRYAYKDSQFDLLGAAGTIDKVHSDVGPGMCPPMTARCGWLDEANPAAVANLTGSLSKPVALTRWKGAPPEGYTGTPAALTVDDHAPDGDRVYLSLRSPSTGADSDWDRGFLPIGPDHVPGRVVAQEKTSSGSTLILGSCPAKPTASMRLGRATLRVEVQDTEGDGIKVLVAEDPWRNWSPLNSPALTRVSRVAAVARLGMIDLVVVGADQALHWNRYRHGMWEMTWTMLDSPPLAASAPVAMATRSPDTMDLFVIARDGLIHRRRFGGSGWSSGWEAIDAARLNDDSGLAACATGEDRVELFCTNADGEALHQTVADGRHSSWHPLPRLTWARAVAAQTLNGHTVQVHAVSDGAEDNRLWSITGTDEQWPNHWDPHGVLSMPATAGIAATARPGGESVLVAASMPMRAESFVRGAWLKPAELVDGLQFGEFSSLAIVARDHASVDVIAVDVDGHLQVITRSFNPDQNLADKQQIGLYPAAFVSPSSRFVSCRNDHGLWPQPAVLADVSRLQEAERFMINELQALDAKQGRRTLVAIQTSTGEFIRACGGGGSFLVGDRREFGPHEQFTMTEAGGAGVILQSFTGHLWSAPKKGPLVMCTGLSSGNWESFQLLKLDP